MSLLETKMIFKAYDDHKREYRREVIITGKTMEDVNHQAQRVARYLTEQTGLSWFIEVSDYKDLEI
jgi:hypothetical protein